MVRSGLIGLHLEEALKELYYQNLQDIELKLTAPGPNFVPEGRPRVVRISEDFHAKVTITVAFENYLKGGVESGI